MANALHIDADSVLGRLFRVWSWFDSHTTNGKAKGVTTATIDRIAGLQNFSVEMEKVGWLSVDKNGVSLPNFDHHCGETAKKRALKNVRQSRWRSKIVDTKASTQASTTATTREEKRRVLKEGETPPDGGKEFWSLGLTVLCDQGMKETSARSFIGSCLKDWDKAAVEQAFRAAAGKEDAKSYVLGVLNKTAKKGVLAMGQVI